VLRVEDLFRQFALPKASFCIHFNGFFFWEKLATGCLFELSLQLAILLLQEAMFGTSPCFPSEAVFACFLM
jgi:hypothetical protein